MIFYAIQLNALNALAYLGVVPLEPVRPLTINVMAHTIRCASSWSAGSTVAFSDPTGAVSASLVQLGMEDRQLLGLGLGFVGYRTNRSVKTRETLHQAISLLSQDQGYAKAIHSTSLTLANALCWLLRSGGGSPSKGISTVLAFYGMICALRQPGTPIRIVDPSTCKSFRWDFTQLLKWDHTAKQDRPPPITGLEIRMSEPGYFPPYMELQCKTDAHLGHLPYLGVCLARELAWLELDGQERENSLEAPETNLSRHWITHELERIPKGQTSSTWYDLVEGSFL